MKRVLVIGCSGSGKTTLARRIGRERSLPFICLDSLYWQPNWTETPDAEFIPRVEALCNQPRWVIDGTFSRTLHLRLPSADTVVWLDLPRRTCLASVLKRYVQWRGRVRPEMPAGCQEKVDWEFIRWIWSYRRNHDQLHSNLLSAWIGREIQRGKCTGNSDGSRRVWWLTSRKQFALPVAAVPDQSAKV